VPGHGVTVPVGAGQTGGGRGCIPRWKVSMMIMRPRQGQKLPDFSIS